jgi:hypothetical protein
MRELHGHNPAETEVDFDNIELYIAPRGRQGARGRSRSASPGRRQIYHPPEAPEANEGPPRYGTGNRIGGRGRGYHFETQKFPLGRGGGTYRNATYHGRQEALFPGAFRDIIKKKAAGTTKPTIKPPTQDPKNSTKVDTDTTARYGAPDNTDKTKQKSPGRTPPRTAAHTGNQNSKSTRGDTSPNDHTNGKKPKPNRTPGIGANRHLFNGSLQMEIDEAGEDGDKEAGAPYNHHLNQSDRHGI